MFKQFEMKLGEEDSKLKEATSNAKTVKNNGIIAADDRYDKQQQRGLLGKKKRSAAAGAVAAGKGRGNLTIGINNGAKKVREIDSPLRSRKLNMRNSRASRDQSPMSDRSAEYGGGFRSPQGSQYENQLRLDLIDEEENIDELLKGTHNFWSKDVERNE